MYGAPVATFHGTFDATFFPAGSNRHERVAISTAHVDEAVVKRRRRSGTGLLLDVLLRAPVARSCPLTPTLEFTMISAIANLDDERRAARARRAASTHWTLPVFESSDSRYDPFSW
jgi:hypothetical protein